MSIKESIRAILPKPVLKAIRKLRAKNSLKKYINLSTQQVFSQIYEKGDWGKSNDPSQLFFSGSGSHDEILVSAYITAVQDFLSVFDKKPDVVDLGCGDFSVGSKIRPLCDNYIACDIVPKLIDYNKEKYRHFNVDFRVLDLTVDELPKGDVVFIRQVLQHLSNSHIKSAIPKIANSYRYLVLTEHLPESRDFVPNLDKPTGPDVRLRVYSGLVLTEPPFNLNVIDERVLCVVSGYGGVIRTTLYTLS